MEEAIKYNSPIHCALCGKESLDIYDIYENPIGYIGMVKNFSVQEIKQFIRDQEYPLSYMGCTNCGCLYCIDWSRGIPQPIYHSKAINPKTIQGRKRK